MATTNNSDSFAVTEHRPSSFRALELVGIVLLGMLTYLFLAFSWRSWPDPVIDNGPQWYATWRLADGAQLYHELLWHYGPLSITLNAWLFRLFGPGMMVLVTANLIIHGLIAALAYVAFRKAWGPLGAFAAAAVFISVFSFSRLVGVGGYDFATPYSNESTHGMLLILLTLLLTVRWARSKSLTLAFLIGLCGGLAAVMKPEFMLAGGLLGIMALALRRLQRRPFSAIELSLVLAGVFIPTLLFTAAFARSESWVSAFAHASHAWWVIFFTDAVPGGGDQQVFSGFNRPWENILLQAKVTSVCLLAIGAIWAAGWSLNRPWSPARRWAAALAALALGCILRLEYGWFEIGRCFPAFTAAVFAIVVLRIRREILKNGGLEDRTVMALALAVLAVTMMARMLLFPRVYHFGFYQGAIAGMLLAAVLLAEVPKWTGSGVLGRRVATGAFALLLAYGCFDIANQSRENHAGHTVAIGSGRDRFYGFDDETTAEINWALGRLGSVSPEAKVVVLEASLMVNYLSRRVSPVPGLEADETSYIKKLAQTPPDYVVVFRSNLPKFRHQTFGAEGQYGHQIIRWLGEHYEIQGQSSGQSVFLRRKMS